MSNPVGVSIANQALRLGSLQLANPSIKRDWRKQASMKIILITSAVPPSSPAPYVKR